MTSGQLKSLSISPDNELLPMQCWDGELVQLPGSAPLSDERKKRLEDVCKQHYSESLVFRLRSHNWAGVTSARVKHAAQKALGLNNVDIREEQDMATQSKNYVVCLQICDVQELQTKPQDHRRRLRP